MHFKVKMLLYPIGLCLGLLTFGQNLPRSIESKEILEFQDSLGDNVCVSCRFSCARYETSEVFRKIEEPPANTSVLICGGGGGTSSGSVSIQHDFLRINRDKQVVDLPLEYTVISANKFSRQDFRQHLLNWQKLDLNTYSYVVSNGSYTSTNNMKDLIQKNYSKRLYIFRVLDKGIEFILSGLPLSLYEEESAIEYRDWKEEVENYPNQLHYKFNWPLSLEITSAGKTLTQEQEHWLGVHSLSTLLRQPHYLLEQDGK